MDGLHDKDELIGIDRYQALSGVLIIVSCVLLLPLFALNIAIPVLVFFHFAVGFLALVFLLFGEYVKCSQSSKDNRNHFMIVGGLIGICFILLAKVILFTKRLPFTLSDFIIIITGWLVGLIALAYLPMTSTYRNFKRGTNSTPLLSVLLVYVAFSLIVPVSFSVDALRFLLPVGFVCGVISLLIVIVRRCSKYSILIVTIVAMTFLIVGTVGLFEMRTRPLSLAIVGGHLKMLDRFLARGYSPNDPNIAFGSPVHAALHYGNRSRAGPYSRYTSFAYLGTSEEYQEIIVEMLRILINYGADINAPNHRGWTPLQIAYGKRLNKVTEFLVSQGANLNVPSPTGDSMLHIAVTRNDLLMLNLFLKHKVYIDPCDSSGRTPLYYAICENNPEITSILLEKGANPNATDEKGHTLLRVALERGYIKMAELLRQHGAKE